MKQITRSLILNFGFWILAVMLNEVEASYSQQIYFEKSFGGTGNDYARSVRQLSDGSIYVAGYSSGGTNGGFDFALNKLDGYGNLLWTKYYGDSLDNNGLYMNTTADGNFVFVGETQTDSNGLDIQLYKIDTAGNPLWTKQYSTSVNESAKYVMNTSDGGYILCGFQNDSFASNDTYIIKTDSDGNLLWDKTIGGTNNEYSDMVRETPEGDFIVTGDTKSNGAGEYDIQVIKLNSAGIAIWDSAYGDSINNGCQGILITSKNKYLSYGETEVYLFSPFDFYLQLLDTNGKTLWKKTFGGTKTDALFCAVETSDGGFMFTGYSNSYSPGPLNLIILKTDSLGNMQWVQNYGDVGIDIGYEIIQSIYNGYLIAGKTFGSDDDFYLLHLDTTGMLTNSEQQAIGNQPSVTVFPNPFSESAVLRITNFNKLQMGILNLKIFNAIGKEVYPSVIRNSDSFAIHRGNLANGIYFYKIKGNEGIMYFGKFVIQ